MNELLFAAVSFSSRPSIIQAVVYLVILGIIWWVVDYFKVPAPLITIIHAVLLIGAAFILIGFLLGITGTSL